LAAYLVACKFAFQKSKWSHFSFFAVWENIRKDEIGELESLFCGIYQKDGAPSRLTNKEGIRKSRLSEKRGKSGRYLKKFD
jgi:hypothetical protein